MEGADSGQQRPTKKLKWTFYHVTIFILTFMSYAFFHATRKTFSNVKDSLTQVWTPQCHNATIRETKPDHIWNDHKMFANKDDAEYFLGALDTAFMVAYAVGLYFSGPLGDRLNMRYVLSFGMCSSALLVFLFGTVTEWVQFYNIYFYMAVWILNGLLQSSGWPTVVAIMGNWFGKSSRGVVFGIWSACASVGNIIGTLLSAAVLPFGYEYPFLVTSAVLFAGGVVVFFGLIPSPREIGMPEADEEEEEDKTGAGVTTPLLVDEVNGDGPNTEDHKERAEAIGFIQAILLPGVIPYSLSYACLKLVNYSFFFWLPFYLAVHFNWPDTTADDLSIWYDVGGIIAGIVGGLISDIMKKRSPVVVFMLILALPSLFIYSKSPKDLYWNGFLMGVTGFFIGGPANLISSAISADLGRQGPVQGNKEALATVAGIVDGTGSVGAAIGQILVPVIQVHTSWQWVFYFFIVMTALTVVCILPLLKNEIMSMRCCQQRRGALVVNVNPD
ncbi:sugar phosphate exchanger 3 [Lingula anatina]|uniref:Sugar phosphate exchanger 3 n=1 Tax=Lingula anatina TaxID=7574 RepID=A0A1S3I2T8_LINAN|nr:sugar phosphate exchanger 3 [Lingula anatina]|eukprot:XP_013392558.1 sugar phosphate exchanger 3 [Lingula anatina]